MGDMATGFQLELTWLLSLSGIARKPTIWGTMNSSLAFEVDNMQEAYQKHKAMGCVCYENKDMGIDFINDPDGYWIEIIPGGH